MTMRILLLTGWFVALGCAKQERDPNPVPGSWIAEIQAIGEHGHSGFAVVAIGVEGNTRANATVTRGSAGGVHPWHIHEGTCRESGAIVGNAELYPLLRPDARGDASATVLIPVTLSMEAEYSVHLHQGPDDDTLVGCGELVSTL